MEQLLAEVNDDFHLFEAESLEALISDEEEQVAVAAVGQYHNKNEKYFATAENYSDEDFTIHFRVSRPLAIQLAERFFKSQYYSHQSGSEGKLDPFEQVLIFLWFAGHEAASFRDVADRFGIAISTLFKISRRLIYFLSSLSSEIIQWPDEDEKVEIAERFRQMGLPNVIGAIDGSHVRIDRPTEDPGSYYNRKKYHSMQMRACEHPDHQPIHSILIYLYEFMYILLVRIHVEAIKTQPRQFVSTNPHRHRQLLKTRQAPYYISTGASGGSSTSRKVPNLSNPFENHLTASTHFHAPPSWETGFISKIMFQATCDDRMKITSLLVGFPGSVHDARAFRRSPLSRTLQQKCGEYYILGDSAYPCSRHLITPFKDNGSLTHRQKKFNKKLSSCRVAIEHCFGLLKQKFRQLYHCKIKDINALAHFIRACCVLHNLAIEDDFPVDDALEDSPQPIQEEEEEEDEGRDAPDGIALRNYLLTLPIFN